MAYSTGFAPGPGPPAEVYIFVLPPVAGGCHSLMHYPRRKADSCVYYTTQGNNPTPGRAREVMWIPSGLERGQTLTISEKAVSAGKGHFAGLPISIPAGTPYRMSGPLAKGPAPARHVTWSYEIILSDATGVLARLDPDIIIIEDP